MDCATLTRPLRKPALVMQYKPSTRYDLRTLMIFGAALMTLTGLAFPAFQDIADVTRTAAGDGLCIRSPT
jgi:hypothetical protein